MFLEAIQEILHDRCTPNAVRAIEAGQSPAGLWSSIADAGFLELLTPESEHGAGLTLAELFPIMSTLGRHAMPLPLGQSMLARGLLAGKTATPDGMLTFAPSVRRRDDGAIVCQLVPFGMLADTVLAQEGESLLLLPCAAARRTETGVPGSLVASLEWPAGFGAGIGAERVAADAGALDACGAALHAALLAGAMGRVFDMTLDYANDRAQFGKSIGKFQAIQHQVSVMAEQVAAASMAAEMAFQGSSPVPATLAAAIAKSRTSEVALLVAATAHAVHGAIGVTEEYDLQLHTRRLHEWRLHHGSESYWNAIVGRAVLASSHATLSDFLRSATPA